MYIRRDDRVRVISGADRRKEGRVIRTIPSDDQVVVENVNTKYRHLRRSQQNPQGGRIQKDAPIDVSNVLPVCQACGEASRVRTVVVEADERTYRYRACKKCGEPIQPSDQEIREKAGEGAE